MFLIERGRKILLHKSFNFDYKFTAMALSSVMVMDVCGLLTFIYTIRLDSVAVYMQVCERK